MELLEIRVALDSSVPQGYNERSNILIQSNYSVQSDKGGFGEMLVRGELPQSAYG